MNSGQVKTFSALTRNLKKDFSGLKRIKLAVLGDSATQLLCQALRGMGYDQGLNLEIWEAAFDQVEGQVLDPGSTLYTFAPDIVLIFHSTHKLLGKYDKIKGEQQTLAEQELTAIQNIYTTISSRLKANVIFYNYPEIDDAVFGNYTNKVESSFLFQLRRLNYELMIMASQNAGLFICDMSSVQNIYGRNQLFNVPVYIATEMVLSIDLLPAVADKTVSLIGSMYGRINKCMVLDLDNTLWGGVIGDDGMENIQIGSLGIGKAFTQFQHWLKKLKDRGIILVVCSKNTESVAKEPFEKHPDMVLRLDDIAVFIANWENKVDNIRRIQNILNIGYDSMVFIDDNPFERNMIRENVPGITVPEMPEDPANYLEYLYSLNLFETVSFSEEDAKRTGQYKVATERALVQKAFASEEAFLESLRMTSQVEPFTKFNIPRVAQLTQRSNQFNLRTVRYTEADIEKMLVIKNIFPFTFTLDDKFGENGLICIVILTKENTNTLFIDTWLMSCRVLKRGMEQFVLNTIAASAVENGFSKLKGEYIPTAKNEMVKDHYKNLGFTPEGNYWVLDLDTYQKKKSYVQNKQMING